MATKKTKQAAPTDAEMKRTVRVWLKKNHPEARDVKLTVWNSAGHAEAEHPILTPPPGWESPDSLTPEQWAEARRKAAHDQMRRHQARHSFVQWWAELVTLLRDVDAQFQDLLARTDQQLLADAGIDLERVGQVARDLNSLSAYSLIPPYTSTAQLWPTVSLTTTFAKGE